MKDYDVAIIGYGPTGAMMAYLLGLQGLSTLVVEPNVDIYKIPRAVHYDGEAMRIFQSLGMVDEIQESSREPGFASFLNGFNWKIFHQDLTRAIEFTTGQIAIFSLSLNLKNFFAAKSINAPR